MDFIYKASRVKNIAAAALGFACAGLLVWTLNRARTACATDWNSVTGY
jgi:hypothetical protein